MARGEPRFTPKPGLRLAVPKYGILLVEEVGNVAAFERNPRDTRIQARWVGQRNSFTLDGREWARLVSEASIARW